MISVDRGPEPDDLRKIRLTERPRIAAIAQTKSPNCEDIGTKYKAVAIDLWRGQHYKCAFCESKISQGYNDVEHYRPKAAADRRPGSTETHGYWWLTFTWNNLLFSCPMCNRSYKRGLFPLAQGSAALAIGQTPPKNEVPLLIDPAHVNGVEHIEFVFSVIMPTPSARERPSGWPLRKHWHPRSRGGSRIGEQTVLVCGLDDAEHIEIYDGHVKAEILPVVEDLERAARSGGDVPTAFERALRLLQPTKPFVGLSYDALRALVPAATLAKSKLAWPEPRHVGVMAPRRRPR